jgi:hypothetical protein
MTNVATPGGDGKRKLSNRELGRLRGRFLDQVNEDPKMTPSYRAVCYQIAKRMMANNGGKARISDTELMARANCCERGVTYAIKTAVDRGHLGIESRCRGDRAFVPLLHAYAVATAPYAVATARPIQEVPAAEGFPKSPSLPHSLNPSEDSEYGEERKEGSKGSGEEGRKISEHVLKLRERYAAGEFPTRR